MPHHVYETVSLFLQCFYLIVRNDKHTLLPSKRLPRDNLSTNRILYHILQGLDSLLVLGSHHQRLHSPAAPQHLVNLQGLVKHQVLDNRPLDSASRLDLGSHQGLANPQVLVSLQLLASPQDLASLQDLARLHPQDLAHPLPLVLAPPWLQVWHIPYLPHSCIEGFRPWNTNTQMSVSFLCQCLTLLSSKIIKIHHQIMRWLSSGGREDIYISARKSLSTTRPF